MKKLLLTTILILLLIKTNYSQDYYIDCPVSKTLLPYPNAFDTIDIYDTKNLLRCFQGLTIPCSDDQYKEILKTNKIPLNNYRIYLEPKEKFRSFDIVCFSRNYCFSEDYNIPFGREKIIYSNNVLDKLKILPMFSVSISEYYKRLSATKINTMETILINILKNLSNEIEFEYDKETKIATPIYSIYINYEKYPNYQYLKKIIDFYLNKSPKYYSSPYENRVLLDQNSIRFTPIEVYNYKNEIVKQYAVRNSIGFKYSIDIVPQKNEINSSNENPFGIKLVNDFIGVVYQNEKKENETLWVKKSDLYSVLYRDDTFEPTLEMLLTNIITNKIVVYHK